MHTSLVIAKTLTNVIHRIAEQVLKTLTSYKMRWHHTTIWNKINRLQYLD